MSLDTNFVIPTGASLSQRESEAEWRDLAFSITAEVNSGGSTQWK